MRSIVLGILASLSVARPLASQVVEGQVVDQAHKQPLPGVRVALLDEGDKLVVETTTDSIGGYFHLDAPRPGKFRLELFDRLGGSYASPLVELDSASLLQRMMVLPSLPATFDGLPVSASLLTVRPHAGRMPRYPDDQRNAGNAGIVRVAFIVDANGDVEPGSAHIVSATNNDFARAVTDVVESFHFTPAAEAPRPARVIEQRDIVFNVDGKTPLPCTDFCITAHSEQRRSPSP
jgi:TonB family protein